jgi:hypothetical protein
MDREWRQSIFLYWFETGLACCGMTERFGGAGGAAAFWRDLRGGEVGFEVLFGGAKR